MTMNALAHKLFDWASSVRFYDKPLPEPEPVNANARPMRGFYAALTPEQKKRAKLYHGEESHGDARFLRAQTTVET
jgi:hypothetical protein